MAGNEGYNDGLWMLFFVAAITIGISIALWMTFKPQLLQLYIWTRQAELAVASVWTDDDYSVDIVAGGQQGTLTFGQARTMIDTITPKELMSENVNKWEIMSATSKATLKPFRIVFGFFMAIMIYFVWFRGPTSWFRKVFKLDDLIKNQAKTFKVIKPIVNFNPSSQPHRAPGAPVPAELPLFAEALSPEEWIAFNKIPVIDDEIDKEETQKAFEKQLMGPWKGAQSLPPYLQVLLAAFALKSARKRDEADDMLGRIAGCWDHKKGLQLSKDKTLLSKSRKTLRNKDISAKILKECNRHAYVTTAMLGALKLARSEGGVLAPAQFIWLRGHERTLWYPLNNLGRQSFHAEAMGAMSHFRAESMVQRPIPKPMVNDAVQVMEEYAKTLKENNIPIPPLDYSMVKNKKAANKNKGVLKPAGA